MNQDTGAVVRELLWQVFRDHCVKEIAADQRMLATSVNKWAEAGDEKTVSPVERTARLLGTVQGDDRLIQLLCERAGGTFLPNPQVKLKAEADLLLATGEVVREMGTLQTSVGKAVLDHEVSRAEAVEIRLRWEKLKAVTEAYVQQCEKNVFAPEPQPARLDTSEMKKKHFRQDDRMDRNPILKILSSCL